MGQEASSEQVRGKARDRSQKAGRADAKAGRTLLSRDIEPLDDLMKARFQQGVKYNMKVVIRGAPGTGKTQLLRRLQCKQFDALYNVTPQISSATINWQYKDSTEAVKVEVWDVVDRGFLDANKADMLKRRASLFRRHTAPVPHGLSEREMIADASNVDVYRGAHAAVFMFDITKQDTFDYIKEQVPLVPLNVHILVLANFHDLQEGRVVMNADIREFVRARGGRRRESPHTDGRLYFLHCSMKDCFGLAQLYSYLNLPFLILKAKALEETVRKMYDEISLCDEDFLACADLQDYEAHLALLKDTRGGGHVAIPASPRRPDPPPPPSPSTAPASTDLVEVEEDRESGEGVVDPDDEAVADRSERVSGLSTGSAPVLPSAPVVSPTVPTTPGTPAGMGEGKKSFFGNLLKRKRDSAPTGGLQRMPRPTVAPPQQPGKVGENTPDGADDEEEEPLRDVGDFQPLAATSGWLDDVEEDENDVVSDANSSASPSGGDSEGPGHVMDALVDAPTDAPPKHRVRGNSVKSGKRRATSSSESDERERRRKDSRRKRKKKTDDPPPPPADSPPPDPSHLQEPGLTSPLSGSVLSATDHSQEALANVSFAWTEQMEEKERRLQEAVSAIGMDGGLDDFLGEDLMAEPDPPLDNDDDDDDSHDERGNPHLQPLDNGSFGDGRRSVPPGGSGTRSRSNSCRTPLIQVLQSPRFSFDEPNASFVDNPLTTADDDDDEEEVVAVTEPRSPVKLNFSFGQTAQPKRPQYRPTPTVEVSSATQQALAAAAKEMAEQLELAQQNMQDSFTTTYRRASHEGAGVGEDLTRKRSGKHKEHKEPKEGKKKRKDGEGGADSVKKKKKKADDGTPPKAKKHKRDGEGGEKKKKKRAVISDDDW